MRLRTPSRLAVAGPLVLLTVACAGPGSEAPGQNEAPVVSPTVLDGQEKSIVLVGYSTSYAWPTMLQEMLDEHQGTRRVHILNAVIGGSPVGRWISAPDTEDYQATYALMEQDFFGSDARLRGDAPAPTIAMLQQSLQRTPTPDTRLGPVTSADDADGIRIGADALETLVTQLRADGLEHVFIAMHIYKEGYEPEVGNERLALDALLRRERPYIHQGPDVWSATIRQHPGAFTDDRLHPNERGGKIIAEAWYRTLAGDAARQDIIDAMHARAYDVDALMNAYLAWRRGSDATQ